MKLNTTTFRIENDAAAGLIEDANKQGVPHTFVQMPGVKHGIVLLWQPDMPLPGDADLHITLLPEGRWSAALVFIKPKED